MIKGNKIFYILFASMLLLYMVSQFYKPMKFDWNITLQNDDKNPFGTYVLFRLLPELFQDVAVKSIREPVYNSLEGELPAGAAYIFIENSLPVDKADLDRLFSFVDKGNIAFIGTSDAKLLADSLGLHIGSAYRPFSSDSTTINFTNPELKHAKDYTFMKGSIDYIFDSINNPSIVTVLGTTDRGDPNFIKVKRGKGFILWHSAPVCFSNYFLLKDNNSRYVSKALSYIPSNTSTVYWDEYYKSGREGASTPLRYFLSDMYLKWALYLAIAALVLYVLFEVKRKQRIIPVIELPKNESLDFVETVASVYFSQHDNKAIAQKKSAFWFDFIRRQYKLSNPADKEFSPLLQKRSGVPVVIIEDILLGIKRAKAQPVVTDNVLLDLSNALDKFYQITKSPIHGDK